MTSVISTLATSHSQISPAWIDAAAHASRNAGEMAIAGLWQGVFLFVTAALCLRLLPAIPAASRFAVWTAVFCLSALLPILRFEHVTAAGGGSAMPMPISMIGLRVGEGWALAIAALWAVMSGFRLTKLIAGVVRVHGVWRRAIPVDLVPTILEKALAERSARLCTSDDVERPSVVGFFSPRVLIPTWLLPKLSPAEIEQVVLHELEHLRRSDDWMNLLQKLGLALLPLNVALLWIDGRLCLEREMACDDGVLRSTHAPRAYATCLTVMAERGMAERGIPEHERSRESSLALAAWERRSELSVRVHRLLGRAPVLTGVQSRVACSAVVLLLLGGSGELLRIPRLVTFSQAQSPISAAVTAPSGTQGSAAEYREASFRSDDPQPRARLLKANMSLSQASASQVVQPIKTASAARFDRAYSNSAPLDRAHRWTATSLRHGGPVRPINSLRRVNSFRSETPPVEVPMFSLKRVSARASRQAADAGRWVVLTSYAVPDTSDEDFVEVRSGQVSAPSYAAVPMGTGWIVFQL